MMFANFRRLLVLLLLIGAQSAIAQVPAPEPKAAEHTVADVAAWVRRDGTEAVMSHDVARLFGWGEADVVVIRMAFTNPESKASFAFDVVRDRPNNVMIARNPGEMLVWQLSESGEVLQTLRATKEGVAPADNAAYRPKWQETMAVFFELVPPATGKSQ
jgi:hypothetical protein